MPHLDLTISLGNILTLAGIFVAYHTFKTNIQNRTETMHTENEGRLTKIEVNIEAGNRRLARIEDWLFRKLP